MIISSEVILLLEYQFLERVYTKAFARESSESSYWRSCCKSTLYRFLFFLTLPKYYIISRIKTQKGKNNTLQYHINFPFCGYTFWSHICVNTLFFFISGTFISNTKIKQMLSNTLRLNFGYLEIIHTLHPHYHPKIIGHIVKISKTICFQHLSNI